MEKFSTTGNLLDTAAATAKKRIIYGNYWDIAIWLAIILTSTYQIIGIPITRWKKSIPDTFRKKEQQL